MRLHKLTLEGFRSYQKCAMTFDPAARTLLFGDNGAGKTNVIEALSYLSAGRSCLRLPPDTAVRFDETFFRLSAVLTTDTGEDRTIEYVFQTSPRRSSACFVNDQRTPLVSFIGALPTIIFLPEHLDLFTGSPQGRRQFLDALLAQLFPDFAKARLEYDRILKQRNAELKRVARKESDRSALGIWNTELARAAMPILRRRREILGMLSAALPAWTKKFGESWTDPVMHYHSKVGESERAYVSMLETILEKDLLLESTTIGPHRDDWDIRIDGRSISTFTSRGQQRTLLIALLAASADLFRTHRNETPILLLDDVYSELDSSHQEALTDSLEDVQIILTSTHDMPPRPGLVQRRISTGSFADA